MQAKKGGGGILIMDKYCSLWLTRQAWPLVREGAPQRQDHNFQTELISGRKSHSGLATKTDWPTVSRNITFSYEETVFLNGLQRFSQHWECSCWELVSWEVLWLRHRNNLGTLWKSLPEDWCRQLTGKTKVRAAVNCRLCEIRRVLELIVAKNCKIYAITNLNATYSH
jgi:hypothetical protein